MKEMQYRVSGFDRNEEEAIEGVVRSMMEVIEPVLRQRVIQWMQAVKTTIQKEDIL